MVRILLLIILLCHGLFASVLLNENLYEREKRVDLMLSFDTPFDGTIKKRTESDGSITILLDKVQVGKPFYQSIRKSFVDSVAVTKAGSDSALVKIVPNGTKIGLRASKTVDGFGLRLRIFPLAAEAKRGTEAQTPPMPALLRKEAQKARMNTQEPPSSVPLNTLQKEEALPGWRYWAVMGVLLLLLALLWLARKRALGNAAGGGWLMPKKGTPAGPLPPEAVIRFQKPLDRENRVILLEFGDRQYLMVVGNSNLLLDTFTQGRIEEEEDFARMFEANKKQLDHFLRENHPDAYEAFKANASREEHL
ncbi:hypothetical protein [Hydrogenimonas sp.]